MEEKNKTRKEWVKTVAIVFLSVMLVLTFFSNTIMNYSLPEVATEYVQYNSISMQVRGTGIVEAGDPYNVIVEENRVIKSVVVENGDVVEKGQILFYLEDAEDPETASLREQIKEAELAYKQALMGEGVSNQVYSNVVNGVTTDTAAYQKSIQEQKNNVEKAEKVISDLNVKRGECEATLITLGALNTDLASANANSQAAHTELNTANAAYNACKSAVDSFDPNVGTQEELNALTSALNSAEAEVTRCKQVVHIADSVLALVKQMNTIDANLVTANNSLTVAQKELARLQSDVQTELSLSAQKKKIDDMKAKLEKADEKAIGGTIVAPVSGTVSSIGHVAGETITAGETVAVMQVEGKGHTLSFSVTKKQAATLSVGDRGEVSNGWYYSDVIVTLLSIKTDPADPTNSKKLTFKVDGDVTAGQSLTVSVGQKSANYDLTVPNNAIREDKNGKFVLVLEQKPSPLGSRYYAVRRNVEVLASDERRSALSGDISSYEYVITTSTKPIQEGQQVRLKDE